MIGDEALFTREDAVEAPAPDDVVVSGRLSVREPAVSGRARRHPPSEHLGLDRSFCRMATWSFSRARSSAPASGARSRTPAQGARRHLLLVEKGVVSDAFHQGVLSRAVHEKLLADMDARLLRLESGETDAPIEPARPGGAE
jgi:hypothetical protein